MRHGSQHAVKSTGRLQNDHLKVIPLCSEFLAIVYRSGAITTVQKHGFSYGMKSKKPTSPLCEPVTTLDNLTGLLRRALTPSEWPSSDPRKGLANTRSSFVAFKARTYSLEVVKG